MDPGPATDAVQGNFLAVHACRSCAVFVVPHPLHGVHDTLAATRRTMLMLRAVGNGAVFPLFLNCWDPYRGRASLLLMETAVPLPSMSEAGSLYHGLSRGVCSP